MKKLRLGLAGISLVCAVIYLGDFVINSAHPFDELGAAGSLLMAGAVLVVLIVRGK